MLGFVDDCRRLGYGGGFYDRTILKLKDLHDESFLSIGVAFEAQKFDQFTGHLALADDVWQEKKCSKISKMRRLFNNHPHAEWVVDPHDQ